jgi:integrase
MTSKKTLVPNLVPLYQKILLFTKPKIFIPKLKDKQGNFILDKNGEPIPTTEKGQYWYVKYSYRNPKTGKLKQFREKKGINQIENVKDRLRAIKNLRTALERFLQEGYSPFKPIETDVDLINKKTYTAKEALTLAIAEKMKVWSNISQTNNVTRLNVFIRFLEKNKLYHKNINEITKRTIIVFLNDLGKTKGQPVNATTRNSYRKNLSSVFNQMVADDIIPYNFIESIPNITENPQKNTPFSKKEVQQIKAYLLENDPYLYLFIKFVMYGFLRPVEVCRIQVKSINLDRNTISVQSKTETSVANVVYITSQLKETILTMDLQKLDPEFYLFTVDGSPGAWNVPDKRKRTYFGNRFLKVKRALNFSKEYGIYSFRHTAAIDLFTTYQKQGLTDLEAKHKMLPITRHKSVDSLNKYLRDIGASLPKDYSEDYSLDF